MSEMKHIVSPYGGSLVNLLADNGKAEELKAESRDWPSWDLNLRQLSDLELLLNGAYSPLTGFQSQSDYRAVLDTMTLPDGRLWPIPVYLDVPKKFAEKLKAGDRISLRDPEGVMLAAVTIDEIYEPDLAADVEKLFGTGDRSHRGVDEFLDKTNPVFLAGKVEGIRLPAYFDFQSLRLTPKDIRAEFARLSWRAVLAYQTDRLIHRADQEFTYKAALKARANLFIHPTVDISRSHDKSYYSQIRCYRALMPYYPLQTARLGLSPVQRRFAGPRETLWHGIINRNFGCSHFVVDPAHTDPNGGTDNPLFYPAEEHESLWVEHLEKLGVAIVRYRPHVYLADADSFAPVDSVGSKDRVFRLGKGELEERLDEGKEIPGWFTFPEVAKEMARAHLPRHKQGFTVFFTGLSGAGKSTVANVLRARLMQMGQRPVTLLDGDIVRKNLSSELGFSKEHRDINIRRIGFVASEITKNGGIAICAPIAPYDAVRKEVRSMIRPLGGFILVHVSTPIEVCEERDRKGLYEKARAGIIKEFTGVSDPYEEPENPEVSLDTTGLTPAESAWEIILYLEREGYIAAEAGEE